MKTYNEQGALLTSQEGNIRSYDTGWVACSDWTNQHLGSVLGGDVVHNLNTPLRNLSVKVFISTDGTDANSFGILNFSWTVGDSSARNMGITAFEVDSNNLIIQTGAQGLNYTLDTGGYNTLETDAYYYRVVVYQMSTVYTGVSMDYYETPWVACSDWTNQHLGTSVGGNLVHNLNAPLSDLLVKILISSDGTDANSWEMSNVQLDHGNPSFISGINIDQVDSDNFIIQTAEDGLGYINATGGWVTIAAQSWYYKIKVYKLTAQPPAVLKRSYDTGWINRSDWTNVHMGSNTAKDVDSNVAHNLDSPLSDLLVKVLISTDGTDANSFEVPNTTRAYSTAGAVNLYYGTSYFQVDDDNIVVQTGANGIALIQNTDGTSLQIDFEDWYYRIKVYKLE